MKGYKFCISYWKRYTSSVSATPPAIEISTPREIITTFFPPHLPSWIFPRGCWPSPVLFELLGLPFEPSFLLVVGLVVSFDDVPPSYPVLAQTSLGVFAWSATLLSPPMLQTAGTTVRSKRKHFNRPRSISLFALPLRSCLVQTRTRLLIVSLA